MNHSYLSKVAITILDNKWHVYFKTAKQYDKTAPEGSRAFCNTRTRTIHFNCEATHPKDGVVAHELMHAYIAELQGHDCSFTPSQFEEFVCTIMETRAAQLYKKAAPLTKKLRVYAKKLAAKAEPEEDDEE